MSGAGEFQGAGFRIENGVDQSNKSSGWEVLDHELIQFAQSFGGRVASICKRSQHGARCRHQQRSRGAFTGNVSQYKAPATVVKGDKVVPIATNIAGRNGEAGDGESRYIGRRLGQERLLNDSRFFGLA